MSRFLVEVPHGADKDSCLRAIQVFLSTGSHYLTNADWGCRDGDHTAWLVVDVDSREEALNIVPPAFRVSAHVVGLSRWRMEEIESMLRDHQG